MPKVLVEAERVLQKEKNKLQYTEKRKLFLFTPWHRVRLGNKTLKRFQGNVLGWDQLESGSKTKDRKFVMCQTTDLEQKMIAKLI